MREKIQQVTWLIVGLCAAIWFLTGAWFQFSALKGSLADLKTVSLKNAEIAKSCISRGNAFINELKYMDNKKVNAMIQKHFQAPKQIKK